MVQLESWERARPDLVQPKLSSVDPCTEQNNSISVEVDDLYCTQFPSIIASVLTGASQLIRLYTCRLARVAFLGGGGGGGATSSPPKKPPWLYAGDSSHAY